MDPNIPNEKDKMPRQMPSCSKVSDSPTKDKPFDPTIDMLVNDFDDERTLEEEEALAADEANDPSTELSNLEREGNMPLDELLALYGYSSKEKETCTEAKDDELEEEQVCESIIEKEDLPSPPKPSKLCLLYEPIMEDVEDSRNVTSVSKISDDEEDDGESNPEKEYKLDAGVHSIMVGSDFQAQVPEGLNCYDQIPANDTEDKILWDPQKMDSQKVEQYLKKAQEITKPIPKGTMLSDDEEALYLLHECGYNVEEALRKLGVRGPVIPKVSNGDETKWSEEECRNFESGVRSFGKDFLQIQQNKVQTKSIGELVQFYYLWKKTERHDAFANKCRLEKKKYSIHPGFPDFMDRFLEDQDKESRSSPLATV